MELKQEDILVRVENKLYQPTLIESLGKDFLDICDVCDLRDKCSPVPEASMELGELCFEWFDNKHCLKELTKEQINELFITNTETDNDRGSEN